MVVLRGHSKSITSLSWIEEDNVLLSASLDGTINMWNESLKSLISVFKLLNFNLKE